MDWTKLTFKNNARVFDTKNVAQNANQDVQYINYGNIYKFVNKEQKVTL